MCFFIILVFSATTPHFTTVHSHTRSTYICICISVSTFGKGKDMSSLTLSYFDLLLSSILHVEEEAVLQSIPSPLLTEIHHHMY